MEYQKAKVWENACGLRRVSLDKCPACPYVLVDGVKVNGRKPAPNQATRATVPASKRGKER